MTRPKTLAETLAMPKVEKELDSGDGWIECDVCDGSGEIESSYWKDLTEECAKCEGAGLIETEGDDE